jgi:hypothetical protein
VPLGVGIGGVSGPPACIALSRPKGAHSTGFPFYVLALIISHHILSYARPTWVDGYRDCRKSVLHWFVFRFCKTPRPTLYHPIVWVSGGRTGGYNLLPTCGVEATAIIGGGCASRVPLLCPIPKYIACCRFESYRPSTSYNHTMVSDVFAVVIGNGGYFRLVRCGPKRGAFVPKLISNLNMPRHKAIALAKAHGPSLSLSSILVRIVRRLHPNMQGRGECPMLHKIVD